MSTIYHDHLPIPNTWVKDELFEPCIVNEQNSTWNEGVDQTQYRLISKYEEHYGLLSRIGRAFLGVVLSLTIISLAFESGREWIRDLFYTSVKNIHIIRIPREALEGNMADVYVSMAGNPAHMGHMDMIALAVTRLFEEGYGVNQVKVSLSTEDYVASKVWEFSLLNIPNGESAEKPSMDKVHIPREKRIEFLKAAIQQAKDDGIFKDLDIDYFDGRLEKTPSKKTFHVCGAAIPARKTGTD